MMDKQTKLLLAELRLFEVKCLTGTTKGIKTQIAGLWISTAFAPDEQKFETALCDLKGWSVVERYQNQTQANKGHLKWVKWCANRQNKKVTSIFWSDMPEENKIVILQRSDKPEHQALKELN